MRTISSLPGLLCLGLLVACSKYLEVRVFNRTGSSIHVCSISEGSDCIDLKAGFSAGTMSWKQGQFTVEDQRCKRQYQVPAIENLDDFRESISDPVNVVVTEAYELQLVRKGQRPEISSKEHQPPGFPLAPASSSACK